MKQFQIFEYLEGRLDKFRRSAGSEITAQCPRCGRYGGFYVNVESGAFVDFKCDWRGRSVVGLVSELEGVSDIEARSFVFRNAVEFRRRDSVSSLSARIAALRPHVERKKRRLDPVRVDLPEGFRACYEPRRRQLWALPSYLKKRAVKSATARAWGIGFCERGVLNVPGRERPFYLSDRLLIPIICPAGRSWTARDMTGTQEPKYLNPPGADHRRLLIGWNMARLAGDLVICEGPLDAIKLWQHELSAVALGGKELHDEQLAQLMGLPSQTVITVMLDPEENKAPIAVAKRLSLHFHDVYLARLPDGVDPGSATAVEAADAIEAASRWSGARSLGVAAALASSRAALCRRAASTDS